MAQINLAPGSQYIIVARRRRRLLYTIAVVVVGISILTGIVLSVLVNSADAQAQRVRQELQSVETQIASASEEVKKIQLFENRLASLDQLLKNHRTWTLHLQEIERLLPPQTVLSSLKASHDSRTIELTGAAPNIDSVAVALATLQNQPPGHTTLFSGGTITNVTQETQTGPVGEVLGTRFIFKMTLTF